MPTGVLAQESGARFADQLAEDAPAGDLVFDRLVVNVAKTGFGDGRLGQLLGVPGDHLGDVAKQRVDVCFGPAFERALGMHGAGDYRVNVVVVHQSESVRH
jgi:hypothetical protein